MKKLSSLVFVFLYLIFSYEATHAQVKTCVDLQTNFARGAESSSVLTLQNFLAEKGYLKVKPNGYFGPSTFAAVKAYQKSVGIVQTGAVYTLTRAAIKKQTCGATQTSTTQVVSTTTIPKLPIPPGTSAPVAQAMQVNQAVLDAMSLVNSILPPSMFLNTASTTTSTTSSPRPIIISVSPSSFISGGALTVPFTITGAGFATTSVTNVVTLRHQATNKVFQLGTYSSTGDTIVATSGIPTMTTSCGSGCVEKLPTGNYDVYVTTSGGESNAGSIAIKGFNVITQSATNSTSIRQKASSTKFGTLSFSSSLPVVIQDVKVTAKKATYLTIASSSILLPTFVTNIKLYDELSGGMKVNGEVFSSTTGTLTENQSKVLTIYGDIDAILPMSVIFEAVITLKDPLNNNLIMVTSPQFPITVSD